MLHKRYTEVIQMLHKNNKKELEKQYRRIVKLSKNNLSLLNSCFSLSGSKTDFQREYGVARQTVTRILINEKGQQEIVKNMLKYARANK